MKMYIIRIKEGNDVMSEEYNTYQEAMYHLMNDNYGENPEEIYYISNEVDWYLKKVTCPKCGNKHAGYTDSCMDCIECFECNHYTGV